MERREWSSMNQAFNGSDVREDFSSAPFSVCILRNLIYSQMIGFLLQIQAAVFADWYCLLVYGPYHIYISYICVGISKFQIYLFENTNISLRCFHGYLELM